MAKLFIKRHKTLPSPDILLTINLNVYYLASISLFKRYHFTLHLKTISYDDRYCVIIFRKTIYIINIFVKLYVCYAY